MKSLWLLLVFTALTALPAAAERDELTVYGGVTVFANPEYDSLALVEFPFSVRRHELAFYQPDTGDSLRLARVFAQVDVFDEEGRARDSAATSFTVRASDGAEAAREGFRVFNRVSLFMPPGFYSARLTVIDALSKEESEIFLGQIEVPAAGTMPRPALSHIQLAHEVRYVGSDTAGLNPRLLKNGFYVLPNPVRIYRHDDSVLGIYAEIYNLGEEGEYLLSVAVFDEDTTLYRQYGGRVSPKPGPSAVVAEALGVQGWPSGLYYLRLVATDLVSGSADTAIVAFRVSTPEELLASLGEREQGDPYDTLTVEQKVQLVTYMLTPDKKAVLDRLSDEGKENYLDQFWRDHDEEPTTVENETRQEMMRRFEFCNNRFSTNIDKSDGWLTDRGRIFMKYGHWESIDDAQTPQEVEPFQIWYYYEMREGKFFIFVDQDGYEDYRLVHSNVMSEVYSREWQDKIDQGYIDVNRW